MTKNPKNAGAKPKYGVPTQRMSLHVPQPLTDRIASQATATGKTRSEIVIETLEAALPATAAGAFE